MPYVTEDNLTDVVMERWKDIPDPRLRRIMQSLIRHLHGFVRDIEPTQAEWAAAIDWLTRTGKLCSEKRQEFVLASDVLGVSKMELVPLEQRIWPASLIPAASTTRAEPGAMAAIRLCRSTIDPRSQRNAW